MHLLLTALADADDRGRPADRYHHHRRALMGAPHRPGAAQARRLAALALTRLSLSSAAVVRWLDACVADDLTRNLRATHGR
jgi:hypothetical protein